MNSIDEAIREGLLEYRIYAENSGTLYTNMIHPKPRWTELKCAEYWRVILYRNGYSGLGCIRLQRDVTFSLDAHKGLHHFDFQDLMSSILGNELQKNMTE